MTKAKVLLQQEVPKEWIDYNGHMNDAAYSRAFSLGVDAIMKTIGINEDTIKQNHYTIYTLETHIVYLDEMKLGETFEVHMSLLDSDSKRLHVFFELYGEDNKRAAVSEQMLMGMDQSTGRPAPFPNDVQAKVQEIADNHTPVEKPKETGRVIGIRKK